MCILGHQYLHGSNCQPDRGVGTVQGGQSSFGKRSFTRKREDAGKKPAQ